MNLNSTCIQVFLFHHFLPKLLDAENPACEYKATTIRRKSALRAIGQKVGRNLHYCWYYRVSYSSSEQPTSRHLVS